jgi:hypothetical protein
MTRRNVHAVPFSPIADGTARTAALWSYYDDEDIRRAAMVAARRAARGDADPLNRLRAYNATAPAITEVRA